MMSLFASPSPPVYPYAQDCSSVTGVNPPTWFNDCNATLGGCFQLTVPTESGLFSVGNTSRTVCDSQGHCNTLFGHGARWCVDHINGKVYTKPDVADAVMFFEIDNATQQPKGVNAPSCRLLVGRDGAKADANVYATDRLLCSAVRVSTANNITYINVGAGKPTTLAAAPPPTPPVYPYPQDCTQVGASHAPEWFKDCNATIGGCFALTLPTESNYNLGNTSRTECDSTGHCWTGYGNDAQWCIDHINGKLYTKAVKPNSVMFFEIDDISPQPNHTNAPSCRFLVGADDDLKAYDARVYSADRILCSAKLNHYDNTTNVTYFDVGASKPPLSAPAMPDCSTTACPAKCSCAEDKCADKLNDCLADATCSAGQTCADACPCGSNSCLLKCGILHPSAKASSLLTCVTSNCAA